MSKSGVGSVKFWIFLQIAVTIALVVFGVITGARVDTQLVGSASISMHVFMLYVCSPVVLFAVLSYLTFKKRSVNSKSNEYRHKMLGFFFSWLTSILLIGFVLYMTSEDLNANRSLEGTSIMFFGVPIFAICVGAAVFALVVVILGVMDYRKAKLNNKSD